MNTLLLLGFIITLLALFAFADLCIWLYLKVNSIKKNSKLCDFDLS